MNMLNKNMLLVLGLLVATGKPVVAMDGQDKGDGDDKVESMAVDHAVAAGEVSQEVPAANGPENDEIEGLTMICEGDASASNADEEHPAKRQRIEPTGPSTLDRTNLIFADAIAPSLPVVSLKALMQTSRGMQGMLMPTCGQRQFGTLVPTMSLMYDFLFPFMNAREIGALAATSRGMNRYIMLGDLNYQRMQQLFDLLFKGDQGIARNRGNGIILNGEVLRLRKLLNLGKFHPTMITRASGYCLCDHSSNFQHAGLRLFEALVEKGQGFAEAIEAASKAVENQKDGIRCEGLRLFEALVQKGQGFAQAIEAASKAVESQDDNQKYEGLKLFKVLVQKGQGFAQAIEAASKAVKNRDGGIKMNGLALFQALVEKGQGFEKAFEAASNEVERQDVYGQLVRHDVLLLLLALVKHHYVPAYEQAEQAANSNPSFPESSEILQVLAERRAAQPAVLVVNETAEASRKRDREDDDQAGDDAPAARRQRTDAIQAATQQQGWLARMSQGLRALFKR